MTTIPELSATLQVLLTQTANRLARESGFIQRQRQVTGAGFAQALVLGGLGQAATAKQLQQRAVQAGMRVSVQGLDQRFSARALTFMRGLLEAGLTQLVESEVDGVLLPSFKGVYVTDCTQVKWAGVGMKVGVRLELQRGRLQACLSALSAHDQKSAVIEQPLPPGALHLGDLGFFKLARFQQWNAQGVYWLSRLKVGTTLRDAAGQVLDLKTLLQGSDPLCLPVQLGTRQVVAAYLLAAPLSEAAFRQRQAHLKERARRDQRPPSARQLALAGWTLYITNLPDLSFDQAHILARTRWQIELLFKLWKSYGNILRSRSDNPIRQQCEGWAKLLGVLIAHWSLLVSGWQWGITSAVDALQVVCAYIPVLLRALTDAALFCQLFAWIQADLVALPPLSKRQKVPLAFQHWAQFDYAGP